MEHNHGQPVTTPIMICDAFAEERFKGNQAAVCFIPTSVYCMEWSAVSSLEASFGRGEPEVEEEKMTEEERNLAAEKYREERHKKMGVAFKQVAQEMNLSETAFVYRLPASRVRAIQEEIMTKVKEFENEYEEKVKQDALERRRTSEAVSAAEDEDEDDAEFTVPVRRGEQNEKSPMTGVHDKTILEASPSSPGLIPSTSFSMANFGASFLDTRASSLSMFGGAGGAAPCGPGGRPRRMHTQWFGLRWFTPTTEVPLCGHATFAAAHAIFESARLCRSEATRHLVANIPMEFFIPSQTDVLCFVTQSGIISVRRKTTLDNVNASMSRLMSLSRTGATESYEVHFPMTEATSVQSLVPEGLAEQLAAAVGLPYGAECVEDIAYAPATGYYVVRLATARNVVECKPNEAALRAAFTTPAFKTAVNASGKKLGLPKGLVVTARRDGTITSGPARDAEVISRFFAPWMGVLEDPVTGSAHTCITPYWLRLFQDGKMKVGDSIQCYQASGRGGALECIVIGRKAERVAIVGSVVTFLRGTCTYDVED